MVLKQHGCFSRCGLMYPLLVQTAIALALLQNVNGNCMDLVADCGAKADNSTDDTAAFAVCQTLASKHSGCITVPAGVYRVAGVQLNTSNIEIRIDNGATFFLWFQSNKWTSQTLFEVGTKTLTSADFVQNVSIHGDAPGHFTIDVSVALRNPWNGKGVNYYGNVKVFLLANMLCKMSNPRKNPATQYPSNNPCLFTEYGSYNGELLVPQDGVLQNLTCLGCVNGYGLIQMWAGKRIHAENLYSEGGVTYRLETGGGDGYLGEIYGKNLTCKDGSSVVKSEPHDQKNGAYYLENLLSIGCNDALEMNGGYSTRGGSPGYFSNSSTITNIVAVYGTHAQNSSLNVDVPSCALCTTQNVHLNYNVTLEGLKTAGFPPPHDRTGCVYFSRWKTGCPYND